MQRFYHIIGHRDQHGKMHYKWGYRLELAFYHLRQLIAFIICPELRSKVEQQRFNLDYVVQTGRDHKAEVRSRDKAIARLQKERKNLRHQVRTLQAKVN